jgi:hypothetical protein
LADDAVGPSERTLYNAITGALGIVAAVQHYGGLPRRASEHLNEADWPRVFDIILRLVPEFARRGRLGEYRNAVNTVLAAHGIVWDLGEDGRLVRVLPAEAANQMAATVGELADPQFQAARELLCLVSLRRGTLRLGTKFRRLPSPAQACEFDSIISLRFLPVVRRYTIGPNSARSRGGSKCVHLPVPISNLLTTFLSTVTKQRVCGSGWAAATSLARVSNCSTRRAIVRVSGASLPLQTSCPAAL